MVDFLFYLFALITLLGAGSVIFSNNPVNAAMLLIVSFVGTASLFIMLGAYFLAAVQLAVYAGAVIVLFLFIIMLLDMDESEDLRTKSLPSMAAMVAFGLLLVTVLSFFKGSFEGPLSPVKEPSAAIVATETIDLKANPPALPFSTKARTFGYGLFTKYMLPFQVTGLLLLVAMVGVIVLSKRHETQGGKQEENRWEKQRGKQRDFSAQRRKNPFGTCFSGAQRRGIFFTCFSGAQRRGKKSHMFFLRAAPERSPGPGSSHIPPPFSGVKKWRRGGGI